MASVAASAVAVDVVCIVGAEVSAAVVPLGARVLLLLALLLSLLPLLPVLPLLLSLLFMLLLASVCGSRCRLPFRALLHEPTVRVGGEISWRDSAGAVLGEASAGSCWELLLFLWSASITACHTEGCSSVCSFDCMFCPPVCMCVHVCVYVRYN